MHKFIEDESGAASIEYALMAALVAVAIIGSARAVGDKIYDMYVNVIAASIPS